jgi:DMSO/TMAO reductase YedYZ molybdopterin-dependent catalytic subunit
MPNDETPPEDLKLPPLPTEQMDEEDFKRLNRRKFLSWAILGGAGLAGLGLIAASDTERELQWPLRLGLNTGDSFWKVNFNADSKAAKSAPPEKPLRLNGDIGIQKNVDANSWRLQVTNAGSAFVTKISIDDLRKLPAVTETFELKCIEGWSQSMSCTGVRFEEFMKKFNVGYRPPQDPDEDVEDATPFSYAGLSSIDRQYYVSMDMKSLLHPQTLLCYEINGEALSIDHGYPLRLMTPVKYGVKNIKQIGSIAFADSPPSDYWAENGYGDYIGL